MIHRPEMLTKVRSPAIMKAAAGMPCTIRISSFIPGRRCSGPETTVGCHMPVWGKGISTKVTDLAVGFGCQSCHDLLDGKDKSGWEYLMKIAPSAVTLRLLHSVTETHALLVDQGVLVVPDGELLK